MKMENLKEFYEYISDSVIFFAKRDGITYERIASYLNVSESFIKQVNSNQYKSHYNIYHLWKLSTLFHIKIDDMLPPINNYEQFSKIKPLATKNEYIQFLQKFKSKEIL